MPRKPGRLGGTAPNHANIAQGYLRDAEEMLAAARTCKDLASVKWVLGSAYENAIWVTGRKGAELNEAIGELNSRVQARLSQSCKGSLSGARLGRRRRR